MNFLNEAIALLHIKILSIVCPPQRNLSILCPPHRNLEDCIFFNVIKSMNSQGQTKKKQAPMATPS